MKRVLLATVVALLAFLVPIGTLCAADESSFDSAVDFSMNIREIDTLVKQNQLQKIDPKKYLLLNGAVASINILQPDESNFLALVELVSGDWTGTEKVSLYRVLVVFSGPEYYKRISQQMSQNIASDAIRANDQLLVVGQFADVLQMPDGTNAAVINAVHARSLQ